MNCLICRQAQVTDGRASVTLERGEIRYVVNDVPAQVCPNCGEMYVDEGVATRVLQAAEQRILDGQLTDAWLYDVA